MSQDPNENSLRTLTDRFLDAGKMTPKKSLKDYFRTRDESNKKMCSKSTQANLEAAISEWDLTKNFPSEKYWKTLSEKRRLALEAALQENEHLHEVYNKETEENLRVKKMLEETNTFICCFKELTDNAADDTGIGSDGGDE